MIRTILPLILVCVLASTAFGYEPAITLRFKSLDGLIEDLRHLYKKAGREDEGKAFEKAMQARTGPKGLEGVDPKKPLGISAGLSSKLDHSPIFLLLPVADEATFLKFVASLGHEPKKQADGSYRVGVEGVPLISTAMFRFAHGYAYITLRVTDATPLPSADKLPTPETALGKGSASVALTAHIDRMPASLRKLAVSFLGLQLGAMKDDEKDPLGAAAIDDFTALLKSLLEEGERVEVLLDLDSKTETLALSTHLAARSGTKLAKDVSSLGDTTSVLAGATSKTAPMSAGLRLILPAEMKKAVDQLLDDTLKKGLDQLQEHEKEVVEPLARAILPTLKRGETDALLQLRGPGKGGKSCIILGLGIKDGLKLETALKTALKAVPEKSRAGITMDVEKAGLINVHSVAQDRADAKTKELLGDGPMYFALRDELLFLAAGDGALEALREAMMVRPTKTQPIRLEVAMKGLAPLLAAVEPTLAKAPDAAREAFPGTTDDRVTLEMTGGERFQVRLKLPTSVLTFAGALDRLRK